MITADKVTETFCVLDEFCKNLEAELTKNLHIAPIDEGYKQMRNRKRQMAKSKIMTILLCYHFGSFPNFKHYYLFLNKEQLASYFSKAVSYTRFVEHKMMQRKRYINNRMHQRTAQKQGQPSPLTPSLRT